MATLEWLLSGQVTAVVTWVGTIFGLVGLLFTFLQAKSAKKSADRASDAANATAKAVRQLQRRLNVANLAYAVAQLDSVLLLINQGHFAIAAALLRPIKRVLDQAYHLLVRGQEVEADVGVIKRNIKTIEIQLEHASAGSPLYKSKRIHAALRGLSEFLSTQENELTFPPEES